MSIYAFLAGGSGAGPSFCADAPGKLDVASVGFVLLLTGDTACRFDHNTRRVTIRKIRCRNLMAVNDNGSSDPYVKTTIVR